MTMTKHKRTRATYGADHRRQGARQKAAQVYRAQHVSVLVGDHKVMPGLAVVLIGEDLASQVYVNNKKKMAEQVGIRSFAHELPGNTSQDELLKLIKKPQPGQKSPRHPCATAAATKQIDTDTVLKAIDPAKDVDGLHIENIGRLVMRPARRLVPCTPLGCMLLIKEVEKNLTRIKCCRRRSLQHCRQAGGAIAAARKLHRDHVPLAHAATLACHTQRGYSRRRRR